MAAEHVQTIDLYKLLGKDFLSAILRDITLRLCNLIQSVTKPEEEIVIFYWKFV